MHEHHSANPPVDPAGSALRQPSADESALSTAAPRLDAAEQGLAFEAWEAYRREQSWIYGMPGLKARPCFMAGYRAGLEAAARNCEAIANEQLKNQPALQMLVRSSHGYAFAASIRALIRHAA